MFDLWRLLALSTHVDHSVSSSREPNAHGSGPLDVDLADGACMCNSKPGCKICPRPWAPKRPNETWRSWPPAFFSCPFQMSQSVLTYGSDGVQVPVPGIKPDQGFNRPVVRHLAGVPDQPALGST